MTLKAATLAAACIVTPAAYAQDAAPWFAHEGAVELTWDRLEDAGAINTLTARIEYAPSVRIANRVTVQGQITVEGLEDLTGDTVLEGLGAFVETLNIQYAGDAFTLYAGKFNPVFGLAADVAPGLYGDDMPKSYEATERVGVGGDVNLAALIPGVSGEHVLTLAAFTADRSVLSGSVFTKREQLDLSDGGLGNTEGLESFVVSLDGATEGGFGYSLGYRKLAGAAGESDERGLVAGLSYAAPVWGLGGEWAAEIAQFDNADGVADGMRTAVTLTSALRHGDWFGGLIVSRSSVNSVLGGGDVTLMEVYAGRDIGHGLTLDAAVQSIDEGGANATLFGARLTWGF